MTPQMSGKDLVSSPGFWQKPEQEQITALSGVSAKFKGLAPDKQREALKALHGIGSASPVPSNPAPPPGPETGGGGLSSALFTPAIPAAMGAMGISFPTTTESYGALGKNVKGGVEKATGKKWAQLRKDHPILAKTTEFLYGAGKMIPELADFLITPAGVATVLAGGVSGVAGVLSKLPPALRTAVNAYYLSQMGKPALELASGDVPLTPENVGEATASATLAAAGARRPKFSRDKAKPIRVEEPKAAESPAPTPSTGLTPEARALVESGKRKAAQGDYEGAAYDWAKAKEAGWKGEEVPSSPQQPPEPILTTEERRKARAKSAVERSKAPQAEVPGLGRRVAPEEVNELPTQKPPVSSTLGAGKAKKAAPAPPPGPTAPLPEGTDFERSINPTGQQYTAQSLPGVPAGATVIPRGSSPQGFIVDLVDSSGRMQQKVLPFHDSLEGMVGKGWLKAKQGPGAETYRGPKPPEPSREPVMRSRGRLLPPPGPAAPPPEGALRLPTPEELASAARPAQPPALLNRPPLTQQEHLDMARSQPSPVIKNFIDKMRSSFDERAKAVEGTKLNAEQKATLKQARQQMDQFLAPFEDLLRERGDLKPTKSPKQAARGAAPAKGGAGKSGSTPPPTPPAPSAPSNVGHLNPEAVRSVAQELIDHTTAPKYMGQADPVRKPWKKITVEALGPKLKSLSSTTIDGSQFTHEFLAEWLAKHAETQGVRVSNPDMPSAGRITKILQGNPAAAMPPEPSPAKYTTDQVRSRARSLGVDENAALEAARAQGLM